MPRFGQKEGDILSGISQSITNVKSELSPLLEEKLKAEAAVNNSINNLSDTISDNNSLSDAIKSQQRVRKIDSPFMNSKETNELEPRKEEYRPQVGGFEDVDVSAWRGGYSGPFILLLTGVLILIGSLITYLVLSFR